MFCTMLYSGMTVPTSDVEVMEVVEEGVEGAGIGAGVGAAAGTGGEPGKGEISCLS